ncbi:zinc finger CCCH domain-containing protein 11A [Clupea harengus]|uniref:Zinc finger CCCH domain-containing protein 11A n=1 Tax=Clupea harengus TaxID=7950 RepID=A0A6P8FKN7_CLUHA|nr:zinc finger CCCH domain-containing protein 11A [Clupea harengus]XP_031424050.1 zinc finger CCCH domain-containing protein 11A [Clupea harengus]XP_031424051.1 zinc finger CCCH domain-containing protein 11A [Clupea harengus]XP_031424052.1 zinc finger CCCH domain-containing protein 11A [Clupea harengus]XP_031424053.1 zinc finger CCCH domain-containing protein 11A [Clupea harengus]XP_031424054.1 zinc finger CCCH domain-containing protein 11A [Clupea harengus]XP_031424055.1 zinc finger CCCH dom
MTNHGDDCYFFYYSTCSKGDSCPFRHCDAAMGSEMVCSLWQENRCFRKVCKFRHMEIQKNRKEIACYWERQPSGCQKSHCAFHHERARFIDGVFVPPNKGSAVKKGGEEEPTQEEPAPQPPNPSNPQLRGVIKADTQENVPSPTHPPVVINPIDDEDEDEDDQFSEEGDERSRMSSPRKLMMGPKDDSLNFGVRTLEEIRLRKALKASLRRAEDAGLTVPSTGEKENMSSILRPALFTAKNRPEEAGKWRITDRLEKRTLNDDTPVEGELPVKRSLSHRLGGRADGSEDPDQPSQRGAHSMRERLGLHAESSSTPSPAATSQPGPTGEIRIKTLEEIRQEKAAKSQAQASDSPPKKITKSFSETLLAKKKQELQKRKVHVVTKPVSKETPEATPVVKPSAPAQPSGGVRVKTLEQIRQEKAARLEAQAQSPPAQDQSSSSGSEEGGAPNKKRILRIKTPSPASADVKVQKLAELPEKPKDGGFNETLANGKAVAPAVEKVRPDSSSVKVKTFEEIMQEKQLRRQEQEATQSQATPAAQKQPITVTNTTTITTPAPSPPAPVPAPAPARQRITVKPNVAPAVLNAEPLVAASAGPKDLPVSLVKRPRIAAAPAPAPTPAPAPAPLPVQQIPVSATPQPNTAPETGPLKKSPENKVKPKVNVKPVVKPSSMKPSSMKPSAHVRPGQKRKAAAGKGSAVAAVKPLSPAAAAEEAAELQEPPCKRSEVSVPAPPSALEAAATQIPLQGHAISSSAVEGNTQKNDLQTVPVFEQSPATPTSNSSAENLMTAPQSPPVPKTPNQTRARKGSTTTPRINTSVTSSTSNVDDFEQLINEFEMDDEVDLGPDKGEDDLLLELSEMIGS